jgi:cell division protein ZapE
MTPAEKYSALLAAGTIEPDPAQAQIAGKLDDLSRRLRHWRRRRNGFAALLTRPEPAPKGLYIHGAVGRGKTMLMDRFFQCTTFRYKRRAHFHEFMAEVHDRIAEARRSIPGDPIPQVAAAIADKTALLCFDEMHITDIADAMILGRLFNGLFDKQVVVVATSNVAPRDLYRNGLNRQLFLPFIDLLAKNMEVEELKAAKDFRLEKLTGKPLYFTPADANARVQMDRLFAALTGNAHAGPLALEVKGRKLQVPTAALGVARFHFEDLCAQPLGTIDFLALAHAFHTIFIDGIPDFTDVRRDVVRRFINLIDTLYDNRVGLVASAAAEPDALSAEREMKFLFERTASRLTEMRTPGYLAARSERVAAETPA